MHTKKYNKFSKIWVQSRVGAIPRLPEKIIIMYYTNSHKSWIVLIKNICAAKNKGKGLYAPLTHPFIH